MTMTMTTKYMHLFSVLFKHITGEIFGKVAKLANFGSQIELIRVCLPTCDV